LVGIAALPHRNGVPSHRCVPSHSPEFRRVGQVREAGAGPPFREVRIRCACPPQADKAGLWHTLQMCPVPRTCPVPRPGVGGMKFRTGGNRGNGGGAPTDLCCLSYLLFTNLPPGGRGAPLCGSPGLVRWDVGEKTLARRNTNAVEERTTPTTESQTEASAERSAPATP